MDELSADEARRNWRDMLDRVHGGERIGVVLVAGLGERAGFLAEAGGFRENRKLDGLHGKASGNRRD